MTYALIFLGLFILFGVLSSLAGASFKVLGGKIQRFVNDLPLGGKLPEIFIALLFAGIAVYGWSHVFDLNLYWKIGIGVVSFFIALAGKESATVFYLPTNWRRGVWKDSNRDGIVNELDMRDSTMRVVNDFLAKILGVDLLSHWYAKIWAFTKGLLISIPIGGICAIFHPIGREIGITLGEYMNKKYGHDVNSYAEGVGDGLSYAAGCVLFLYISSIV